MTLCESRILNCQIWSIFRCIIIIVKLRWMCKIGYMYARLSLYRKKSQTMPDRSIKITWKIQIRIWLNIVSVHVYLSNDDDGRQKSQRNVKENDVNKNMMAIPTNQHISTKLEMMWIFVHSFVDFFFFSLMWLLLPELLFFVFLLLLHSRG